MSDREWKEIADFPEYLVSNQGDVYSIGKGKILIPQLGAKGYLQVQLYFNGKRFARKIHRLVIETFIGLRPPGMEICHADNNHQNNYLWNLRYDTSKANSLDSCRAGNRAQKLSEYQVRQIRKRLDEGESARSLGKIYGVSGGTIGKIKRNEIWTHL